MLSNTSRRDESGDELVEGNPGQLPAIDAVALVDHRAEVLGKLLLAVTTRPPGL
jgi:hypothetical protein